MDHLVFAPGCALYLYKPEHAARFHAWLNRDAADGQERVPLHLTCCDDDPCRPEGTTIVDCCAGCDKRYREQFEGISAMTLWELLADDEDFPLPDYGGARMALHDPCPVRKRSSVHDAVRKLLTRMHIEVVEPAYNREKSICCGDSFHGKLPDDEWLARTRDRAEQMPCEDVAVYCVACVKSMARGGKTPRYLPDLIFGETTTAQDIDPDQWQTAMRIFRETHAVCGDA